MMLETYNWIACVVIATASIVQATLIDLSHDQSFDTLMSPKNPQYRRQAIFDGDVVRGVYARFNSYSIGEHGGTHLDAPSHFNKDGLSLDKIPLENTIADGVMVDCSQETANNENYALTVDKLKEWEEVNGEIPYGAAVVLNFNWSHRFNDSFLYFNTKNVNDTDTYVFPHISAEACDWLVDEKDIKILAVDGPSPDLLSSLHAHVRLLKSNRLIVENLNDPGRLPATGFRLHATPVKFVGATGVQVRAFAVTHDSASRGRKSEGGVAAVVLGFSLVLVSSRVFSFL